MKKLEVGIHVKNKEDLSDENGLPKNKNEPCSYCGKLPSEKNCEGQNPQLNWKNLYIINSRD